MKQVKIVICSIITGKGQKEAPEDSGNGRNVTTADTLMDLVRNCFPPNIIQSTMQQYTTVLVNPGPGITVEDNGIVRNESDKHTWAVKGKTLYIYIYGACHFKKSYYLSIYFV